MALVGSVVPAARMLYGPPDHEKKTAAEDANQQAGTSTHEQPQWFIIHPYVTNPCTEC